MGNAQDPTISESPFLHPRALKYPAAACPRHGKTSLRETGKDLEREEAVRIGAHKNLPGQTGTYHMSRPSLPVDLGSVCFTFYYWWPRLHISVYAGNRGQHFLGFVLGRKIVLQSFIFSVCCQFSPLNPVSGSKQSLFLGVKIPFLSPCLAFLEDTLAHSPREALFSRHKHGVVARGCDNCVLQTFKARVPERYLHVKLSG